MLKSFEKIKIKFFIHSDNSKETSKMQCNKSLSYLEY